MAINILVVDDAPTMRKIIIKTIKISGQYAGEIYEAGNGIEALQQLDEHWVDLIITDINMPEMDGMEMLKRLKSTPEFSRIPVIAVTSRGRKSLEHNDEWMLITEYLSKPFHPEKLRDVIFSIIGEEYAQHNEESTDECDF